MTCARVFLVASLFFCGALASLYPTSPVAGTVYDAGRQNLIEWVDDDPKPHLDEISVLKVDLYSNDDVCLLLFVLVPALVDVKSRSSFARWQLASIP